MAFDALKIILELPVYGQFIVFCTSWRQKYGFFGGYGKFRAQFSRWSLR
jgi:hypothetical protein